MIKLGYVVLAALSAFACGCGEEESDGTSTSASAICSGMHTDPCGQCTVGQCGSQYDAMCGQGDLQSFFDCTTACDTPNEKCTSACWDNFSTCEEACTDSACCSSCSDKEDSCEAACPPDDGTESTACTSNCEKTHAATVKAVKAFYTCAIAVQDTGAACGAECTYEPGVCGR